jgi:hypothetical protein
VQQNSFMQLKTTTIILATAATFAVDIIEHDKTHLHDYMESKLPVYNPTAINVYGIINNQLSSKTTFSSFVRLAL